MGYFIPEGLSFPKKWQNSATRKRDFILMCFCNTVKTNECQIRSLRLYKKMQWCIHQLDKLNSFPAIVFELYSSMARALGF